MEKQPERQRPKDVARRVALAGVLAGVAISAPAAAYGADCRFSQADKQSIRQWAVSLQDATPAITALGKTRPTRAELTRGAQVTASLARTARASQVRVTNPTVRRGFRLYSQGFANLSTGIRLVLAGDGSRGNRVGTTGRNQYRQGQDVLWGLVADCGLGAGSLAP